jgi:hypothetical protein
MIIHSTFQDFIVFLYVHISRADDTYDPSEMATIEKKIGGLYDEDVDVERKLYVALREYNTFDRSKLATLFKASFEYFSEDQRILKNNFYDDLKEIMLADGKVELSESNALLALKELIELNSKK